MAVKQPTAGTSRLGADTLGDLNFICKDIWLPMMQTQFANYPGILNELKRKSKFPERGGRDWYAKAHIRPSQSYGARTERAKNGALTAAETYPTPTVNVVDDFVIHPMWNYFAIRMTHQAMKLTKGGAYAFAEGSTFEVNQCMEGFLIELDRQLMGNGSGIIGKSVLCADETAMQALVTNETVWGTNVLSFVLEDVRRFRIGEFVDVYWVGTETTFRAELMIDAASSASTYNVGQVVDVDPTTNKVYVECGATSITLSGTRTNGYWALTREDNGISVYNAAGTALLVPSGTGNSGTCAEIMGLAGIYDDGSNVATIQNLSRVGSSGYRELQSYVNSNTGDLTVAKLKLAFDCVNAKVKDYPDAILWNDGVDRAIFAALEPFRRFTGSSLQFGYDAIPVVLNGKAVPVLVIPDMPKGQVLMPKWNTIEVYQISDPDWIDIGGVFHRTSERAPVVEAEGFYYANTFCSKPASGARMEVVTEA